MAESKIKTSYLTPYAYNTGDNTQILTNIPANTAFGAVGVEISNSDAIVGGTAVVFGKRVGTRSLASNSTHITEQNGKILFNPNAKNARLYVMVNFAPQN